MVKLMVACLMASALLPAANANQPTAESPQKPIFSFMGDDTETVTTRTELNGSNCSANGDILRCEDFSSPEIAGTRLKWLSLSYNKGRLYQVIGASFANRFDTILEAFTIKYGKPSIEVKKWQSKGGATFDNSVATWEFNSGQLQLSSLGTDINTLTFTFVSTANAPPHKAPKIDF